jgi:hypothetical protein
MRSRDSEPSTKSASISRGGDEAESSSTPPHRRRRPCLANIASGTICRWLVVAAMDDGWPAGMTVAQVCTRVWRQACMHLDLPTCVDVSGEKSSRTSLQQWRWRLVWIGDGQDPSPKGLKSTRHKGGRRSRSKVHGGLLLRRRA